MRATNKFITHLQLKADLTPLVYIVGVILIVLFLGGHIENNIK